jgi:triosephosphate isomerase
MAWGAQDVASFENGAFTGEVSASMLRDLGCRWVIVGHSERRTLLGDTDDLIAHKAERALAQDIGVIVCVGETLEDRESDRTESVLAAQIDASRVSLRAYGSTGSWWPTSPSGRRHRAYRLEQAQAAHVFIRSRLAQASADAARAHPVWQQRQAGQRAQPVRDADIDGGLIGGASLVAERIRCDLPFGGARVR